MASLEQMQQEFMRILDQLNFADRYYALYAIHNKGMPQIGIFALRTTPKADIIAALGTTGLQFKYDSGERFYFFDQRIGSCPLLKLHVIIRYDQAEFCIYIRASEGVVGGTFHGLALKGARTRDEGFTLDPPYPRLKFSDLDELGAVLRETVVLFADMREALCTNPIWT